jgi:hypothetical protein
MAKNRAAAALGKLGGRARAKLPKEKLTEIGEKGAAARWKGTTPQERREATADAVAASAKARRARKRRTK